MQEVTGSNPVSSTHGRRDCSLPRLRASHGPRTRPLQVPSMLLSRHLLRGLTSAVTMYSWWNGRHASLRGSWPQGRGGSNPLGYTKVDLFSICRRSPIRQRRLLQTQDVRGSSPLVGTTRAWRNADAGGLNPSELRMLVQVQVLPPGPTKTPHTEGRIIMKIKRRRVR